VSLNIKVGNNVAGRRMRKQNKLGLSPKKVAARKGWHNREIKLKKSKHEEGHIAPGRGMSHNTRIK
jgi:hypothetical protein